MDNLELIKRIISSDELCDQVNSLSNRDTYVSSISAYLVQLCSDIGSANSNIDFINRYLRKFVVNSGSKEDIFFDSVLLRLYSFDIKDSSFVQILNSFNFYEVKELLVQRYNQYVVNNSDISNNELVRMLSFYCYLFPNYVMSKSYINYFTYRLVSKDISLDFDLMCYYYRAFALCFSRDKDVLVPISIMERVQGVDPYYDNDHSDIVIYKQSIKNKVDYVVLADIFYQIKYLYLINCINSANNVKYSFEQLRLVKEVCLISVLGSNFFDSNYGDISFSCELKKQSRYTVRDYYRSIGINIDVDVSYDVLAFPRDVASDSDSSVSIDVLFDLVLKKENPNLLRGLIKSYPVLGCEYKFDKRKSLLKLLLDIYSNRKLLNNLNKDLAWHNGKLGNGEDDIIMPKINRLNDKISVCSSYIEVMSTCINSSDMTSDDLVRSISDLITYDTHDLMIQNDICSILSVVVPRKIKKLCTNRDGEYKEFLKQKIIKCYVDSMGLSRSSFDSLYFMKIYSSLDLCIKAID